MILQVRKKDIAECVSMIKNSFITVADRFGFTEENAPRYTPFYVTEENLEEMMSEKMPMFAYFDDATGKIIGYYALKFRANGACELRNLCVAPDCRLQGVGTELFRHSVKTAKSGGCKSMRLSVVEEYTEVREWYERMGAVHVGTQKYDFFPFTCGYLEVDLTKADSLPVFKKRVKRRKS